MEVTLEEQQLAQGSCNRKRLEGEYERNVVEKPKLPPNPRTRKNWLTCSDCYRQFRTTKGLEKHEKHCFSVCSYFETCPSTYYDAHIQELREKFDKEKKEWLCNRTKWVDNTITIRKLAKEKVEASKTAKKQQEKNQRKAKLDKLIIPQHLSYKEWTKNLGYDNALAFPDMVQNIKNYVCDSLGILLKQEVKKEHITEAQTNFLDIFEKKSFEKTKKIEFEEILHSPTLKNTLPPTIQTSSTVINSFFQSHAKEYSEIFAYMSTSPQDIISTKLLRQRRELRSALVVDAKREKRKLKDFIKECEKDMNQCDAIIKATKRRNIVAQQNTKVKIEASTNNGAVKLLCPKENNMNILICISSDSEE